MLGKNNFFSFSEKFENVTFHLTRMFSHSHMQGILKKIQEFQSRDEIQDGVRLQRLLLIKKTGNV